MIFKVLLTTMVLGAVIFGGGITNIQIGGYETTVYVVSVLVYYFASISVLRKRRLSNVQATFCIAFLGISLSSACVLLIHLYKNSLINIDSAILYVWHKYAYGCVLLYFITTHVEAYKLKNYYLKLWLFASYIVIIISIGQALAVMNISPFTAYFLWDNVDPNNLRISATFRWPGHYVMYLGLTLPLFATKILITKTWKSFFLTLLILIAGLLVLFFSGSRTSIAMVALITMPLIIEIRHTKYRAIFSVLVVTIGVLMLLPIEHSAIDRAFSADHIYEGYILASARHDIINRGLSLWLESPLVGIGPNQLYEYIGFHPHNSYLELLVEMGIIGGTAMIIFIAVVVYVMWLLLVSKNSSKMNIGLAMGLGNWLIYNLSASAINYAFVILYFGLCIVHLPAAVSREGQFFHRLKWRGRKNVMSKSASM